MESCINLNLSIVTMLLCCHDGGHDQRGNDDGENPGDPPRDRQSGTTEEWSHGGPGSAGTVFTTGCRGFLRGGVCVSVLVIRVTLGKG